jgi:hypothetical protein
MLKVAPALSVHVAILSAATMQFCSQIIVEPSTHVDSLTRLIDS